METRNIVKSGPSSYVVSLPVQWVKKNQLDKGDFLYLEERSNQLIYSSRKSLEESRDFFMEIDGKSLEYIAKMIKSAYLTGYNSFILKGETVKDRISDIRKMINELVAVEIMEQDSERIVAQEMLDKQKNSPEKIIRRVDMIIRGMFDDIHKSIGKKSVYNYIIERDSDINRLHMLSRRLIIVEFKEFTSKSYFDNLMNFKMIDFLEMIADSLKLSSKYSDKITIKKDAKTFFQKLRKSYLDVMKIYYTNNSLKAVEISRSLSDLQVDIEKFLEKKELVNFQFITPLREMLILLDEITLVVLNKNT